MGICIISRFAFAGRFTGGGVPVTLSALHYPPMKRCSAVALFESSPCQHKKQTPCRDTARGLFLWTWRDSPGRFIFHALLAME